MRLKRLGNKRVKRSETWAYVCAELFGGSEASANSQADDQ